MSTPPVLRRSSRNRAPPRNPDSPISHAPPPAQDQDSSSSDEEDAAAIGMARELQAGIESDARQRTSDALEAMAPASHIVRDTGHEHIAADSLLAAQLQAEDGNDSDSGSTDSMPELQTLSDDEGDDGDPLLLDSDYARGSRQEQADRIISDIVLLQRRDPTNILSFLAPALSAGVPSRPPPSQQIGGAAPVATALASASAQATGQIGAIATPIQDPERTSEALYFIGIHSLMGARSFVEVRAFADPNAHDGALVSRLQRSVGPLARALATVTDRASFFVGVSDYPIDVIYNYGNWLFRFRELEALLSLEQSRTHERLFNPIPPSTQRTALLTQLSLPDDMPVYVVYDTQPPLNMPPAFDVSMPTAAAPSLAPPTGHQSAASSATAPLTSYLLTRFATHFTELTAWRAASYGTAYSRRLAEWKVIQVCQALGIGVIGRQHTAVSVDSYQIRIEDVVQAAGINFQTWGTWRTELGNAKKALSILRRLERTQNLPGEHEPLLRGLEAMFRERLLPAWDGAAAPNNPIAEAEAAAVTWSASWLNTQSRHIINAFEAN
ncbi:hypothetical protein FB45DRAFT_1138645 [Roridomyces roridus]|uniref:Uncharacterized protein n=1 Tax=Roridomyces roridus TaxID=1738132 RepID=A0AAD7FPZ0_9AGAR|nr:hypothetical protein FB45DRAFT_1138645 [Roridomyces roridus]